MALRRFSSVATASSFLFRQPLQFSRLLCNAAIDTTSSKWPVPRVKEFDPEKHTNDDLGKFYSITPGHYENLVAPFLKAHHRRLLKTVEDPSLMIRAPSQEVIGAIRSSNLSLPVIKHMLYGPRGVGVTAELARIALWAHCRGWLVVPFLETYRILRYCPDIVPSGFADDRYDSPTHSCEWLTAFTKTNQTILNELSPVLTKDVQWNLKESAPIGTTWSQVITFGLNRPKYATDVIGILLREIRHQASILPLPTLVCLDGVNMLWSETRLQDGPIHVPCEKLSLIQFMRRLMISDWTNGAIVGSVGQKAAWKNRRESHTPKYLLTNEGFKLLEPFIPYQVSDYSLKEVRNILKFYVESGWITNPSAFEPGSMGQKEIITLSGCNPQELDNIVQEW